MTATSDALAAVRRSGGTTLSQRLTDNVVGWLARRSSRRGFLVRSAVVGSALTVDTVGFALKPQSAYASVCGPGSTCGSGWTVFCATINKGVNACPPGSIAAGWWKADGAYLCGGKARYIIDCNATCSRCLVASGRPGICSSSCWSCSCRCGPGGQCDQRKVCCNGFRYGQCNQQVRWVGGVVCRVVSCVPPWTFEKCSTAPATDNRTRDHSSPALPNYWTRIKARYTQIGDMGGVLGPTVYGEIAVPNGRAQRYVNGRMSDTPSLKYPRHVLGKLALRYAALGNEAGVLGFPVADPVNVGGGQASQFQKGRISWHPTLGAFETVGPISVKYNALGNEVGVLRWPIISPRATKDGQGRYSSFQRGRISWHPTLPARWISKDIEWRYVALEAEGGRLGYPVADEVSAADGVRTAVFQRGRIVYAAGVGAVEVYDIMAAAYVRAGSLIGVPKASEVAVLDGRAQDFTTGRVSGRAGEAFWTRGPIWTRWVDEGLETGLLGFPTSDEYRVDETLLRNEFERGSITYDESDGSTTVSRKK